jgi:hypothetical protein
MYSSLGRGNCKHDIFVAKTGWGTYEDGVPKYVAFQDS